MRPQGRTADREIARIAARSHGVVTRAQLLGAGITPGEIKHRVAAGALLREYRGVYRVGHRAPSTYARYLAAVRACGDGAMLAGLASAHLFGVVKGQAPIPEVITPTERRVPGVATRRARRGEMRDRSTWHGIPTTSVAWTLVDLAGVMGPDELARACHEASVQHRTTPVQVESVLARRPSSRGAATLRRVLLGDINVTLSALEARFLQCLREARLALPQTNRPAGGRRVDCRWPEQNLTVELDSYRFHASRHAWELDRRRDREARARGDELRRYTYGDVFERPQEMLAELRALLPGGRPG